VGKYTLEVEHSGQCLQISSDGDEKPVRQNPQACSGDDKGAVWELVQKRSGRGFSYKLKVTPGQVTTCLAVLKGSTRDKAAVVHEKACNGANSDWKLERKGDGFILRAVHSGQCLHVKDASQKNNFVVLQGSECDGDHFIWKLKRQRR